MKTTHVLGLGINLERDIPALQNKEKSSHLPMIFTNPMDKLLHTQLGKKAEVDSSRDPELTI